MATVVGIRIGSKRHQQYDDKQQSVDEYGNNKRQKVLVSNSNGSSNIVESGSKSPAPTSTTSTASPLSPVPSQQEINADIVDEKKPDQKLRSIGPYQLLAPLEENSQTFTAKDTRVEGRVVVCRRLDRSKYVNMMKLGHRLLSERDAVSVDDEEENRRAYEQIFPAKSEMIAGDDGHFYFFEPEHFGSLHAYVVERKRLSEQECLWYSRQIVRLLVYCHRRRIVLRDLKLRKFVFADKKRLTIRLDGLDELYICPDKKRDDNDDETQDDKISDRHGCPAYVGPEILDLNQKSYSGRAADMWSLGVLLYVILYGRYPFYDTTPAKLFAKIRHANIHLTDEAGISFEARSLIRCLLRRDPNERPSAADITAHPWLQSGDRARNSPRRFYGAGYVGSMVNTATGVRIMVTSKNSDNDQCVPCADVDDKQKSGKKINNGPGIREIRRTIGTDEPNVPSQ